MVTMKMKNQALSHLCASFASDDHAGDPWTFMIKLIGTKGATATAIATGSKTLPPWFILKHTQPTPTQFEKLENISWNQ